VVVVNSETGELKCLRLDGFFKLNEHAFIYEPNTVTDS